MLTIQAPAKINLTLEVLGKRNDGYHEILSIIQTINLCDVLHFRKADDMQITADLPGWQAEKSILPGAVRLVQNTTGYSGGVKIALEKHIPLIAGLGGESSDAAAVLLGLNRLWELNLSRQKLARMAAELGSDVTFFLHGGTALLEGRGERVTPLPPFPEQWVVLVVPPGARLPGKTVQQYNSLEPGNYTDGAATRRLAASLKSGKAVNSEMLLNTFEKLAFQPGSGIEDCRRRLLEAGAESVHLAGSGPTLFVLHKDRTRAEELYTRCREQGWETYLVTTCSP